MAKKWYNFFVVSDTSGAGATESPRADVEPPVTLDGAVSDEASPDAIYAAARIATPPHGYTILKVAEMLESEHIRELPADVRRKSVLVALDAAGVPVKDIVEDAIQRDRALDTYERVLDKNLDELQTATAQDNARLEAEVDQRVRELRAAVEQNNQALLQSRRQLDAWRAAKRAEETRIADAVGYFVPDNPIHVAVERQGESDDVR
jgi:hypothetical protein